jgi:hypothetical protein
MTPEAQFAIGALLTVAILSYLIGDNPLYRLATHILVGVGAAYVLAVALGQVLIPRVFVAIFDRLPRLGALAAGEQGDLAFALFGLLGCVFLFAKLFRRAAWLGNVAVGYMIGVGAGVAVGGAILGTLGPQTRAASQLDFGNLLAGLLALGATLTALIAFTYNRAIWRGPIGWIGRMGQGALQIALGATFALVFIASASVLTEWVNAVAVTLNLR